MTAEYLNEQPQSEICKEIIEANEQAIKKAIAVQIEATRRRIELSLVDPFYDLLIQLTGQPHTPTEASLAVFEGDNRKFISIRNIFTKINDTILKKLGVVFADITIDKQVHYTIKPYDNTASVPEQGECDPRIFPLTFGRPYCYVPGSRKTETLYSGQATAVFAMPVPPTHPQYKTLAQMANLSTEYLLKPNGSEARYANPEITNDRNPEVVILIIEGAKMAAHKLHLDDFHDPFHLATTPEDKAKLTAFFDNYSSNQIAMFINCGLTHDLLTKEAAKEIITILPNKKKKEIISKLDLAKLA